MTQFHIGRTPRVRPSPYFDAAVRWGLKGVTVFREGCKGRAVLVRGTDGALEAPDDDAVDCPERSCA